MNADSTTTERGIARDLLDYLRANPGVCAEGNVHGWRWVRYHDGEFHATTYGGDDRQNSYVSGEVLDEDAAVSWLTSKPVSLLPASEAYQWRPSDETVWEDADEQDVFRDYDRCWFCGGSERDHDLTEYETVEDGDLTLYSDCHCSCGQIVGEVQEDATA